MNAIRPTPAAFRGTFSGFALVKTRDTARFEIEVPLADADAALAALGGLPRPGTERWVAVALLNPNMEGGDAASGPFTAKSNEATSVSDDAPAVPTHHDGRGASSERKPTPWSEKSAATQAGIRCADVRFQAWLKNYAAGNWRDQVQEAAKHGDGPPPPEMVAAYVVRDLCNVESRADIDAYPAALSAWQAMDTAFMQDIGLLAKEMGR